MSVSWSISTSKETDFPVPSQLFSLIPIAKDPPLVPIPAPAEISPVGLSSTLISIFLRLFFISKGPLTIRGGTRELEKNYPDIY